jgi:hypothetical protein
MMAKRSAQEEAKWTVQPVPPALLSEVWEELAEKESPA